MTRFQVPRLSAGIPGASFGYNPGLVAGASPSTRERPPANYLILSPKLKRMEEHTLTLADYVAIFKRRKWQMIWPAIGLFFLAAAAAAVWPPTYESTGTILIEQQEIPSDLVRSTVTTYAAERVQTISRRVMTTENLGKIIDSYKLYPDLMHRYGLSAAVDQMRKDIDLQMISADVVDPRSGRPSEATIAFSLSYQARSPDLAQRVANDVVTLFLNENLKERQQAAKGTATFLESQAAKVSGRISTLEAKLAVFKKEYGNSLPELKDINLQLMQQTEQRLRENQQSIRTLEDRKIYLQGQLALIDPFSDLYSSDGKRVLGPEDRLKALEAQYASVAARYSKDHPQRILMEREIAILRREVGQTSSADLERKLQDEQAQLADLRKRYSPAHPDVKRTERAIAITQKQLAQTTKEETKKKQGVQDADNPAYIQLQNQLQSAEAELGSLQVTRKQIEAQLADYESRLAETPKIEREYLALTRDHDTAVATYKDIKQKEVDAQLGEAMETARKGERFSLIEPPELPEQPAKPNRLAIVFLGFVLACGGGAGNLALQEAMDKSVHGTRGVEGVIETPPLAVIPYIDTDEDIKRRRKRKALIILAIVLGVVLAALAVQLFVMPLDILWFQLLDRVGLLDTNPA